MIPTMPRMTTISIRVKPCELCLGGRIATVNDSSNKR
jgi:hypothetical protein